MAAATTADIIAFVRRDLGIDEKVVGTRATIERAEEDLGLQGDGTIIERARKLLSELGAAPAASQVQQREATVGA